MSQDTATADATDSTDPSTGSSQSNDGRPTRNPARRVFAREFNDAWHQYKESDDERAPNWSTLPTGERALRVFVVGTLTGKEEAGNGMWRAVVNDGTEDENFFVYAGEYAPEAAAAIRETETPATVAVIGKISVYVDDDGDDVRRYVSIDPETFTVVDQETRREWVVDAAEQTFERVDAFENALEGDGPVPEEVRRARDRYGADVSPYRDAAAEALESVIGDVSDNAGDDGAEDAESDTDEDAA